MNGKSAKLPIPAGVVKDLLSKSLSRTFNEQVEITDFTAERLSIVGRKSDVYKLDLLFDFPGRVFSLPPVVAAKFYLLDHTEDITTKAEIQTEYNTEKQMLGLSDDLVCRVEDKEVRVLQRFFSEKVGECDDHLALIREFAPEDSLSAIVLGKQKKQEDVHWTDINGTIFPLALLHLYDLWIRERVVLPEHGPGWVSDTAVTHLRRIANHINREDLEEDLAKELKGGFMKIFTKYLSNPGLIRVINGDLNVSPRHATKGRLLDAGRSSIGQVTDDLALYSDQLFNNVLDSKDKVMGLCARGKSAIGDYIACYNTLAEILHYPEFPKGISKDFLMMSFLASALRGNLKGASASLVYGNRFLEQPNLTETGRKRASENYAAGVYDSIRLLGELGDTEDRITLINLSTQIRNAGLNSPSPYEHETIRPQRCPRALETQYGAYWRKHTRPENSKKPQHKTPYTKEPA